MNLTKKQARILSLLMETGETYGWNLVEADDENVLKKSSIYNELYRLEKKGFLTSRKAAVKEGDRGLPKRYFQINGTGMRALAMWETVYVTA